jgi:cell division protein ZapA
VSEQETVTVTILDRPFQVSCLKDERAALEQSARFLDNRMREIRGGGKVIGVDRIAVMAALNIAHEMLAARGERDSGDKRIAALRQRVEAMVAEHTELDL